MLEIFYKNKEKILKKSLKFFSNSNSHLLKIGCELEFFLLQKNLQAIENQGFLAQKISELKNQLTKNFSLIYQVEKERGVSQIEVKTIFTDNLFELCCQLENAKSFIKNFAVTENLIASFAAQPFLDDCGNALQFNLSLHGANEENIFLHNQKIVKNIANSLLENTNSMMIFLAPNQEDYLRFCPKINQNLFKQGKFSAPINLSFGVDNRTCAIRFLKLKESARLEFRVAAANAEIFLSVASILLAISLPKKDQNLIKIHGNAFDEQYGLENFCSNLVQANDLFFAKENFIRQTFLNFSTQIQS
jgi:glutamine synthetase